MHLCHVLPGLVPRPIELFITVDVQYHAFVFMLLVNSAFRLSP